MTKVSIEQTILETILEKLGVKSQVSSSVSDDGTEELAVITEDSSLLIGHHGETLQSIQSLVKLIAFKTNQTWKEVKIDCGDYRKERVERLKSLAERSAEKARFLSTEVALPPMSSSDRREVHLVVKSMAGVVSESMGMGRDRYVVIRPTESGSTEKKEEDVSL